MNNMVRKTSLIVMSIIYLISSICGTIILVSISNGYRPECMHEVKIATIVWLVLMPVMILAVAATAKRK